MVIKKKKKKDIKKATKTNPNLNIEKKKKNIFFSYNKVYFKKEKSL